MPQDNSYLTRDNEGLYLKYQSYIETMERLNVKELTVTFEIVPGFTNTDVISYEDCFRLMNIAWEALTKEKEVHSKPLKPKNPHHKTRTHCANGHELTEKNIIYDKNKVFRCGDCVKLKHQRYQARQKGLPFP